MSNKLSELNKLRSSEYLKNETEESFLDKLNSQLIPFEHMHYKQNLKIEHPLLFTFGLPRSGTTLTSQLMAYGFEIGYINNFMARFWKAPVTGIKLSKILLNNSTVSFESNYASTKNLNDIHEYGYFWREYLKKQTFDDIEFFQQNEEKIDWDLLYKIVANMLHEFNMGWAAKNILGSYHIKKLTEVFEKVLFIYIERDVLDSAVSILNARKKYYTDLNNWWSYAPPEINKIKGLSYMEQIAGQVFYLKEFYEKQLNENENVIKIHYADLCKDPQKVLLTIQRKCKDLFDYDLEINDQNLPESFVYKQYNNNQEEKETFQTLINKYKKMHE